MIARLDHVVIGGTDLGMLVAWWKHETGVDPARGGVHEGFGTHNALVGVDDTTYIELIARDRSQIEPARPRPFGIDDLEPNSVQLCSCVLAVEDIAAANQAVRAAGFDPGPVTPMRRLRADGVELRWELSIPPDNALKGALPALIQWGLGTPHPGSTLAHEVRVEEIVVGHPEPARLGAALSAIGFELVINEEPQPSISAHLVVQGGTELWL